MTHDELYIGQTVVFDVRGERVGKITDIFTVNGARFCALIAKCGRTPGFVEGFPRVGFARIYPNMPIPK